MEYRRIDYNNDLEEVVGLIKKNLNPGYSEEILKWKHLKSPFGPSIGLVAVNEDRIVGVVFAALYVFQNNSFERVTAIRFFDACTESDQRGKGIFKSLMANGLKILEGKYDFSLSNPNEASLKGHLRVGYREPRVERYYEIGIIRPLLGSIRGELRPFKRTTTCDEKPLSKQNVYLAGNHLNFINWRYIEDKYHIFEFHHESQINYIVYRIEIKNRLRAIILCNYFGDNEKINLVLNKICRREKTFLVYYLQNSITDKINFILGRKYKKAVVVFKNDLNRIPENLIIALGDLEGRL